MKGLKEALSVVLDATAVDLHDKQHLQALLQQGEGDGDGDGDSFAAEAAC